MFFFSKHLVTPQYRRISTHFILKMISANKTVIFFHGFMVATVGSLLQLKLILSSSILQFTLTHCIVDFCTLFPLFVCQHIINLFRFIISTSLKYNYITEELV